MTILRDIQEALVAPNRPLASILRQCLILGYRLNSHEFQAWVRCELEGYRSADSLPDYRYIPGGVRGNLEYRGGGRRVNTPLMIAELDPLYLDELLNIKIHDGVATVKSISQSKDNDVRLGLPKEMAALIGLQYPRDVTCTVAYKLVSKHSFIGILDTVRTRALDFTLQIEAENPRIGEPDSATIPSETVEEMVTTIIYARNVHTGSGNMFVGNDTERLKEQFRNAGATETQVTALVRALAEDQKEHGKGSKNIGARTLAFLGKMSETAVSAAVKVIVEASLQNG